MKATCGGCTSWWAAQTRRCHCSACHFTFANIRVFDAHRWARGRGYGCYLPQELNLQWKDGTWYDDSDTEE
jgi:hypothetical protein